MRRLALALATLLFLAVPAHAGELVMFEAEGCPWCALWHRQIGPIYPKTAEGKILKLRQVDVLARPADLAGVSDIRYTPTFVAMVDGREVGRIVGYPGEGPFWDALAALHARALTAMSAAPTR